jgi:predicted protein tyrosine phosphatase
MPAPQPSPMIHVCPLAEVERIAAAVQPRRVLSVLAPTMLPVRPAGLAPADHLHLAFHDIVEPREGLLHPTEEQVADIIAFVRGWDQAGHMLVHCWAGVSRSTAAAYIALCALNEAGAEAEFALLLRTASPTATPNRLMVAHADRLLDRDGRMIQAIDAIGTGAFTDVGQAFALPSRPMTDR